MTGGKFYLAAFCAAAMVQSLAELTQLQLLLVIILLGAAFGCVGKITFYPNQPYSESALVGSAMGFIGVLGGSYFEESMGRDAVVAFTLLIAVTGKEGMREAVNVTREFVRKRAGLKKGVSNGD